MGSFGLIHDFTTAIQIFISSGLFFDEVKHGLVSSVYAAIFYYKFRDIKLSLMIVAITYIIDSDHLIDYFIHHGFQFSFSQFIRLEYFRNSGMAFVPFHAWEWVIAALLLSTQYKKHKKTLYAFALGIIGHLTWDVITVGSVIFYSIIYRTSQGFMLFN